MKDEMISSALAYLMMFLMKITKLLFRSHVKCLTCENAFAILLF